MFMLCSEHHSAFFVTTDVVDVCLHASNSLKFAQNLRSTTDLRDCFKGEGETKCGEIDSHQIWSEDVPLHKCPALANHP